MGSRPSPLTLGALRHCVSFPLPTPSFFPTGGQARLDAAVGLLKIFEGKQLLVSDARPSVGSATLRLAINGDRTLSSCCVDVNQTVLGTLGTVEQSAAWVDAHEFRKTNLVANKYPMPRLSLKDSRLISNEAEVTSYRVMSMPLSLFRAVSGLEAFRLLATGYAKFSAASARGPLSDAVRARSDWRLVEASDLAAPPPTALIASFPQPVMPEVARTRLVLPTTLALHSNLFNAAFYVNSTV